MKPECHSAQLPGRGEFIAVFSELLEQHCIWYQPICLPFQQGLPASSCYHWWGTIHAAVQVAYCAQLNDASDKEVACQQQQAQDVCRRSCDLCRDNDGRSSLFWYNQDNVQGSIHAPTTTTPLSQAQAASNLQDSVVSGKSADLTVNATQKSVSDIAVAPVTNHSFAGTLQQSNNSSSNHSSSSHAAALCDELAECGQVSMHVAKTGGDIWINPVRKPLLGSVLVLCALLLLCIVKLARGATMFKNKRALR